MWRLLKTVIAFPFVVVVTVLVLAYSAFAFLWDCATPGPPMEDVRQEKHRYTKGKRENYGPQG